MKKLKQAMLRDLLKTVSASPAPRLGTQQWIFNLYSEIPFIKILENAFSPV